MAEPEEFVSTGSVITEIEKGELSGLEVDLLGIDVLLEDRADLRSF